MLRAPWRYWALSSVTETVLKHGDIFVLATPVEVEL